MLSKFFDFGVELAYQEERSKLAGATHGILPIAGGALAGAGIGALVGGEDNRGTGAGLGALLGAGVGAAGEYAFPKLRDALYNKRTAELLEQEKLLDRLLSGLN